MNRNRKLAKPKAKKILKPKQKSATRKAFDKLLGR